MVVPHYIKSATSQNAVATLRAQTREEIKCLAFSLLPRPPYSPDFALSDFHLFPKLKEHLWGKPTVRQLFAQTKLRAL